MTPAPQIPPLVALAAHPDDLEFACGALIAKETSRGGRGDTSTSDNPPRPAHFIIVTRGESASHGTPAQRAREARASAKILGATLQFLPLAKDAALKPRTEHALKLAAAIRKLKPSILLAPTLVKNQHPDHAALGTLAQTAARLARYAGIKKLRHLPPHAIDLLLFYAITPDAEPRDTQPILIDISDPQLIDQWTRSMQAHASQLKTRNYLELQLTRARLNGLRAGTQYAIPLFPNDPLLLNDLSMLSRSARAF